MNLHSFILGAVAQVMVATGHDNLLDRLAIPRLPIDNPILALKVFSSQVDEVNIKVRGLNAPVVPFAAPSRYGHIVIDKVGKFPGCLYAAVDSAEQQVKTALECIPSKPKIISASVYFYDRREPDMPLSIIVRSFSPKDGEKPFGSGIQLTLEHLVSVRRDKITDFSGALWVSIGPLWKIEQAALEVPGTITGLINVISLPISRSGTCFQFPFFAVGDGGASTLWIMARMKTPKGEVKLEKVYIRASTSDGLAKTSRESPWFWPEVMEIPKLREPELPPDPFMFTR